MDVVLIKTNTLLFQIHTRGRREAEGKIGKKQEKLGNEESRK